MILEHFYKLPLAGMAILVAGLFVLLAEIAKCRSLRRNRLESGTELLVYNHPTAGPVCITPQSFQYLLDGGL